MSNDARDPLGPELPCGDERARLLLATERAVTAELVDRFAQGIARHTDLPRLLAEAIARTSELCEADGASLLRVDSEKGDLYFDTASGASGARIQRHRLAVGQGIAGRVATTATPVLVTHAPSNPHFESGLDRSSGFRTGSVIAAPLIWGGDVIGVLEAVRSVDREPFAPVHLARLERLVPHVSIALHHAHMTATLCEAQAQILSANADLENRVRERTAQIARGKQEWEHTFDAIMEPIALQDGFTVRRANLAYARQAGVPITQVPGRKCHQLLAGRSSPCHGCPLVGRDAGATSGEVKMGNSTFRFSGFKADGRPGEPLPTGESAAPESTVVVHYQDVTQQRSLEARLRETERMVAVGQLASGAAHEINNPLGFVISNLEQLKATLGDLAQAHLGATPHPPAPPARGPHRPGAPPRATALQQIGDEAQEIITECLSGAQRVAHIVRSLRDLSRLRIGASTPTSLNSSVARSINGELKNSPHVQVELGADASVAIDPLELEQAIAHILRNARQAVSGSQRIQVRTRVASNDRAQIEIQDEGIGIPSQQIERIFEPFFTTRGIGKGLGLGLTASWGIVSQHGGEISVKSEPGQGSTFIISLPLAPSRSTPRDADSAHPR